MADVARDAGVSTATVSYVVNDRHDAGISPPTQERVLRSIERLGYRPTCTLERCATSGRARSG